MLLKTLVGPRAGQVEDYDLQVALNALATGSAQRLDAPVIRAAEPPRQNERPAEPPPRTTKHRRRR